MIIEVETASGTQSLWKQERIILKATHTAGSTVLIGVSVMLTEIASYVVPSSGVVLMDVTDLVRAYPSIASITVAKTGGRQYTIPVQVVGLINPENDIIPDFCDVYVNPDPVYNGQLLLLPPSFAIKSSPMRLEFRPRDAYESEYDAFSIVSGAYPSRLTETHCIIPISTDTKIKIDNVDDQETVAYVELREPDPEKDYVTLQWVSRYGVLRAATFERRNVKYATKDTLNIMDLQNEYDVRKGQEVGFTAVLEGLNAYDYWYYSDIITSSLVKVGDRKVEVTTKDVTMPNSSAGEFRKLELQINYAKYDTL